MLKKILYTLWVGIFLFFGIYTAKTSDTETFLNAIENKTFDLRQSMIINSNYKKPNEDIVIVAIDDASYEFIMDKYGEWPMPRDVYAKLSEYIEAQHPKCIAFDLMFVKSLKSSANSDIQLTNIFKKYNNIYTAMNFDNQEEDLRTPANLPDKLSLKVTNNSKKVNYDSLTFINCRTILADILNVTNNIGFINVSRAEDGVLRKMPVFLKYQDKYYPQLAFKIATNLLGNTQTEYIIDKNSILKVGDRKIYLDKDGGAILNWYGPSGTYKQIPLYTVIEALENKKADNQFENKIVYFGTTASSLFDIKTTPTSKIYPGVEVQATYVNNLLDNNFIRKFYIVLANEDIYYYDDKEKTKFLGMHHLIGCIIKEPSINDFLEIDNIKFYSFSITFNNKSKIRKYYSPNFQIVNQFTQNLKKGIGYIHFNDYYEIENKIIGKGKFGVVNLGIDKKTGNKVAIKIINKSSLKTEIDKELIKSEIDIMKLCHHPNIVKLLDHFENSEYIYIVMEYISGGTLNQYIKSHYFYISESEAANIILQIGNGLKYLHNYGIVHRDLKTDNIMLTKNNENGIIKIMDFGLSKVVGPNEGLIDGYGTLNYCAPEVLMREPYNKQIDIWSLGIILFYMLVGHFPFQGNNEEIIAKKIVYQPLKFDEKEWENKSKKVINLIEKSLEKKPNKRINIDDFLKHPWIKKNLKQKMSL